MVHPLSGYVCSAAFRIREFARALLVSDSPFSSNRSADIDCSFDVGSNAEKREKNRNALMGLTLNTMIVFSVKYLLPLTHDYSCSDSILLLASRRLVCRRLLIRPCGRAILLMRIR